MANIYSLDVSAANNASTGGMNWAEGQSPGTVNNSARQMAALIAQFLADIGGNLEAGGTANALTLTANSDFTEYADGIIISFKASADNSSTATLSVNGIGAKAIRKMTSAGEAGLDAGDIKNGYTYVVRYSETANSAAGAWLLDWAPKLDTSAFATLTGTQTLTNKTLTSPVLTTPQINDTSADHQYVVAGSELAADRTVTLPLLTGDDTFVFAAHTQTLTNKTLTSPTINSPTISGLDASLTAKGIVELATNVETAAGTSFDLAVTPAGMHAGVGSAIAAQAAGTLGTYAMLRYSGGSTITHGTQVAGTSLTYADAGGTVGGANPAGTWECCGRALAGGDDQRTTLWKRVG